MNLFFAAIGKNIAAKLPAPSGNATIGADRSDLGNMSLPATNSYWDLFSTNMEEGQRAEVKQVFEPWQPIT